MLKMMGDSQVRDRGREVAGLRSAKQRMARIAMHRQLRSTIVYLQTQPQQVPISCDSTQWRSAEIQHRTARFVLDAPRVFHATWLHCEPLRNRKVAARVSLPAHVLAACNS